MYLLPLQRETDSLHCQLDCSSPLGAPSWAGRNTGSVVEGWPQMHGFQVKGKRDSILRKDLRKDF